MTETLKLIRAARDLLAVPTVTLNQDGEYFAFTPRRDPAGVVHDEWDISCMCIGGALLQSIDPAALNPRDLTVAERHLFYATRRALIDQLADSYRNQTDYGNLLEGWNDQEDTTKQDALNLFDKTIRVLESANA